MDANFVSLRPDVVIEPLIDSWYAWSHLISPATAARNVAKRHLPIMRSYVQARGAHVAASRNPAMRGGPFIDFPDDRTAEVQRLLDSTCDGSRALLCLSDAIDGLNSLIAKHPAGESVESVYARVPEELKGYVELVFDLHHRLSYRLLEPLLYRSPFYNPRAQSLSLWRLTSDRRPFVFSTPRIRRNGKESIRLDVPFDSPLVDLLGQMKFQPAALAEVSERLRLDSQQRRLFETWCAPYQQPRHLGAQPGSVKIQYFNHACVLVQTGALSIMIDPLIGYVPEGSQEARLSWLDLPPTVDLVLLTHNHQDHVLLETLLQLRTKIGEIVVPPSSGGMLQDPSLRLALQYSGFNRVVELGELDTLSREGCQITAIPFFGEHGDLDIRSKLAYHLRLGELRILFVADSAVLESRMYEHVFRELGKVDILFIGMECDGAPMSWLYGPLTGGTLPRDIDKTRRLNGSNSAQALRLVELAQPAEVYIYAMAQEPWLEFISSIQYTDESRPIVESNKLIAECRQRGIVAERLCGSREFIRSRGA